MAGKLAGRYQIVKHLGGGGLGQTFLARDTQLPNNPICVVKLLKPQSNDPSFLKTARRLFDTEAQILQKLGEYEQIPRLLAYFEDNQEFYIVQQFIDGHDLSHEMQAGLQWSEEKGLELLRDVLTTLAFVHQHNVIHRDLKPANLMRRKQDGKIVLIDFGAVKEIIPQATKFQGLSKKTVAIGTSGYMPSEQTNGKPKLSSDIYALGIIAIQAFSGLNPSKGQIPEDPRTGEIVWRNYTHVSSQLAKVLDKMVRYDFRQRYPSAAEALQALPQLPGIWTRRRLIQVAGWGSLGLVGGIVSHKVITSDNFEPSISEENEEVTSSTSGETNQETPTNYEPVSHSKQNQEEVNLQSFNFDVVTVDNQGRETSRKQGQAQFFQEDLGDGVTLDMVAIPGGKFLMGSPDTEKWRKDWESPQHWVTAQPFYMGKFTITQAQWRVVAALPQINRELKLNPSYFEGDNLPVKRVSWDDSIEFCARLSQKTGRTYRLPSEAQWEYACRSVNSDQLSVISEELTVEEWNEKYNQPFHFGATLTDKLANYGANHTYAQESKGKFREKTTPVGSFPPNAFGLYDMHGNVWEWCLDHWHSNYQGAPSDGSAWLNKNDNDHHRRLGRGGSWYFSPALCRSASRDYVTRDYVNINIGFRVVWEVSRTLSS